MIIHSHIVYLIVDALGSHLIPCKDCAALSRNCIVLIIFFLLVIFLFFFFLFISNKIPTRTIVSKFWVTRIVVTVDSSSFLLIISERRSSESCFVASKRIPNSKSSINGWSKCQTTVLTSNTVRKFQRF